VESGWQHFSSPGGNSGQIDVTVRESMRCCYFDGSVAETAAIAVRSRFK
jgi:hypothetical protein